MKNLIVIIAICVLASCGERVPQDNTGKYIIETTLPLKSGVVFEVLELFKSTNPDLVKDESEWISASFSSIPDEDVVMVRAIWKTKEAYMKFSNSENFKLTMSEFGKYFADKPSVTISKVLFEM